MALTRNDHMVEYEITGAGLLSFPFSFPARDRADIHCYDVDAAGAATEIPASRFEVTVSSEGLSGGGSVRLVAALATGHILRIRRETPTVQQKVFTNQATIPPPQVEDGLDILTMIAQEHGGRLDGIDRDLDTVFSEIDSLHQADADLSAALAAEAQARQQADTRLQQNIDAEAAARLAADNLLQANINAEATARQQADSQLGTRIESARAEASALVAEEARQRQAADAALQTNINAKADASDLAAYRASVDGKLTALQAEVDGKMPKAPADGNYYLAQGGAWSRFSLEVGDPYEVDADGCVVFVARPAYRPNAVFDITPDAITISSTAQPGDGDSVFVVDADGCLVIR